MDGLTKKLIRAIHNRGYIPYSEVIKIARQDRFYKEGTIERRLRIDNKIHNEEVRKALACIDSEIGEGGYIKGYRWICEPPKPLTEEEKEVEELEILKASVM